MRQTIIAHNQCPGDEFCVGIIVETDEAHDGIDPVQALRDAAKEFLATPRGQKALQKTGGCFNWGDLVDELPDTAIKRHGLSVVDTFQTDLVVQHGESLLP